ncbi:MAG: hypothetical protein ACI822_001866, partial [Gammaproteobacteria bacterium]
QDRVRLPLEKVLYYSLHIRNFDLRDTTRFARPNPQRAPMAQATELDERLEKNCLNSLPVFWPN